MKSNESLGNCPICEREMLKCNSNRHHLIPKAKGGTHGEKVRLHKVCHEKIHSIWSENEIKIQYSTIDLIMEDERMQTFAKWIAKKDSNFKRSNKLSNNHRGRRR